MILIIGGLGFIGSNLANELNARGEKVHVIDNKFLGESRNLSKGIPFTVCDARDLNEAWIAQAEAVYHLGAPSSSPMYKQNPEFYINNLEGFWRVARACYKNDVKLIYSSSSSIYNNNPTPFKETQFIKPKTLYEAAYYTREQVCNGLNLNSCGLRFFSVYGNNEEHKGEYANIVSQFYWSMKNKQQPVIYGDGSQKRDFVHVSDVVRALLLARKKEWQGVVNVGTGKSHSFNDVVNFLNQKLNTKIKPKYTNLEIHNYVYNTQACTSLAESLGFKAKTNLKEGIKLL